MSTTNIVHKCECKVSYINSDDVIVDDEDNMYHKDCEGFISTLDDMVTTDDAMRFKNFKKYDLGDVVLVKGYKYIVDSIYDDGVAEILICDCDSNCKDKAGFPTRTCFNCSADRRRLEDDEDGNADWEWVNGFTDKMTIINEPEITIKYLSKLSKLKVRIA